MTTFLNSLANLAYRSQRSRIGTLLPVVLMLVAIVLIALAKPDDFVDTTVYDFKAGSSPVMLLRKYVRVRGTLAPAMRYQSEVAVGQNSIAGSKYVPVFIEDMPDPLFVLDRDLPEVPETGGLVDLIGFVETKDSFPAYYLVLGDPPNIPLQNQAARAGIVLALLVLAWWLLAWLLRRVDFAPAVRGQPASAFAGLQWSGGLGSAEGNGLARETPVTLNALAHELRFEADPHTDGWAVHVRRLLQATAVQVASVHGALPALRLRFEDERGQLRSGTLIAGTTVERERALRALETRRAAPSGAVSRTVRDG